MDFPKGTTFRKEKDPETGQIVQVAVLPNGDEVKFWTDEDLEEI